MTELLTPEAIIREIIRKEGGWVDHKNDKGGATNFGISLRYARSKGLMFDLDGDGDVDAADIRLVTKDKAFEAFMADFYLEPGFDKLPLAIRGQMTDFAVNSGAGRAVKYLQLALASLGYPVGADGQLGPKSYKAVETCCARFGVKKLNNALVDQRCKFLAAIVAADSSQRDFINGWNKRARSFLA